MSRIFFPTLSRHTNLATTAKRYVKAAGIIPWSDFWNSLRVSRQTDLMDSVGSNDACRWIGNSLAVAAKHYQLMKKEAYSGRAKSDATTALKSSSNSSVRSEFGLEKRYLDIVQKSDAKSDAAPAGIGQNGAEKKAANPVKTWICDPSGTPSRNHTRQQYVDETQGVGQQVGQLSSIEHLEQALHHLSLANEHALAKEVLLRLIEAREAVTKGVPT